MVSIRLLDLGVVLAARLGPVVDMMIGVACDVSRQVNRKQD